jgi:protein-S-isoprenylcysteine O-methyltransferase Ste14
LTNGERLAAELRRAMHGEPWHGPSVSSVLSRLDARKAAHRRARGSHTAWELVRHLTVWAEVPLRRFDEAGYSPTEAEDFPAPASTSDAQWRSDVAALGSAVERLAQHVEPMSDDALEQPVGTRSYSYSVMVNGVVQHLAYHAGQMAVLARSEETAEVIAPPPLIAVAAIAAAEGAQRFLPLGLRVPAWVGAVLALGGLALVWWAHEHFVRSRTSALPWVASRALVNEGPYAFTRNPMYVGLLAAMAGIGVMRANAWYLVLIAPAWAVLHWGVVLREERYLLRRFGAPYQRLLDTTRRWL